VLRWRQTRDKRRTRPTRWAIAGNIHATGVATVGVEVEAAACSRQDNQTSPDRCSEAQNRALSSGSIRTRFTERDGAFCWPPQ